MTGFVIELTVAFGVTFVAEFGDKSQLLAFNFGARHPLRTVAIGLMLGYAAAGAVAVLVGGLLGSVFPDRSVEIVGGIVFVAFAIVTLRADDDDQARIFTRSRAIASIALTIALAEMGDKTLIATATLASQANPLATWIGAVAGETASGILGAYTGVVLGDRTRPAIIRCSCSTIFALFGVLMLLGWF
jgi:putative Ca2+/H+ antiporter (TMEM165/GDT1 family)